VSARRRAVPASLCGLLLLAGCGTSFVETAMGPTVTTAPTTATSTAPSTAPPPGAAGCPAQRAAPDPRRPVVELAFDLAADLRTVTGTETVTFTPDLPVDQLVFRLVPNAPLTAEAGNRLVVDAVRGDDVAAARTVGDGAAEPGGLHEVDLVRPLAAGTTTRVELDFTLTLGRGGFDRVGATDQVAWWGSGAPLLAWEPGVGWARDPFPRTLGETATSPAADTAVRVTAPAGLTVLMTGDQAPPSTGADGRLTWTSREPAARDVSVAAGRFTTSEVRTPGGVRVTAGVLGNGDAAAATALAAATARDIGDLESRFGAFPYRTLTVARLPDYGGGIEYPGAIQLAAAEDAVRLHEVAHMWFYGMVGDDQFRDPWLDEAFATYAQSVRRPVPEGQVRARLQTPGDVGADVGSFADDGRYFAVVYGKGGAALLAARSAAGPDAFDAALRCYVDAQAWRTARPGDLARALADLPAALDVLEQAGALR
jgi:hypothetical protein